MMTKRRAAGGDEKHIDEKCQAKHGERRRAIPSPCADALIRRDLEQQAADADGELDALHDVAFDRNALDGARTQVQIGHTVTRNDAISSATQETRKPTSTRRPRVRAAELRRSAAGSPTACTKPSRPPQRSCQATSAQTMPSTPSRTSRTGKPPAAVVSSRRDSAFHSSVGMSAISHSTSRMLVADVDHGSDTATATASPSAATVSRVVDGCPRRWPSLTLPMRATARFAAPTTRAARARGRSARLSDSLRSFSASRSRSASACHRCKHAGGEDAVLARARRHAAGAR